MKSSACWAKNQDNESYLRYVSYYKLAVSRLMTAHTLDMCLSRCFWRKQLWRCRMHDGNLAAKLLISSHLISFNVGMGRCGRPSTELPQINICNNELPLNTLSFCSTENAQKCKLNTARVSRVSCSIRHITDFNRSLWRRVFSRNWVHWYWQSNSQQPAENTQKQTV